MANAAEWIQIGHGVTSLIEGGDSLHAIEGGTGNILQYLGVPGQWKQIGGPGSQFVAGSGFVAGLTLARDHISRWDGTGWTVIGGAAQALLAFGSELHCIEAGSGNLLQYLGVPGQWKQIGGPGDQFVAGSGFVAGLTLARDHISRWDGTRWTVIGDAAQALLAFGSELYCIEAGSGYLLHYEGTPGQWTRFATSGEGFVVGDRYAACIGPAPGAAVRWKTGLVQEDLGSPAAMGTLATVQDKLYSLDTSHNAYACKFAPAPSVRKNPIVTNANGTTSITYSTELMQNFQQAEIMRPEAGFQALQTTGGNPLLFSIGTDQSLYATAEVIGDRHGWDRSNLSVANGPTCKAFAVAQAREGSIHVAMALSDATGDHLYLSLKNSAADTSWIKHPAWVAFPYDDPDHPRSQLNITGISISEASDAEYVIVDVNRDGATNLIFRYYIDVNKAGGYAWHPHDVPIDIQASKYVQCMGRTGNQAPSYSVDGIYTSGSLNGASQFVYTPLYNVFDPTQPPASSRLCLPGGVVPEAIATCRNADNSTDLYASANGKLYYFSSTNQTDNAVAVEVKADPLLSGLRSLFAFATGTNGVMVWGLNANDEIFYTTCSLDRLTTPSAWSVPLPILGNVEAVSPFVNRANSANSFFAHTGDNKLTCAVKSPGTLMWSFREITIPAPANAKALSFSSYTTRIQVNQKDNKPASNVAVSLSASNVTSVYINHLYYVLSPTPIQVNTDVVGSLTIVEKVTTLAGSRLTVSFDGATATINCMDKALQKAAGLTTPDALKRATIQSPDGSSTRPLVAQGTSDVLLDQLAASNRGISTAYSTMMPAAPGALANVQPPASHPTATHVDFGDLCSSIWHAFTHAVTHVVELVKDAFTDAWHFVVTIAGKVYHAVLDCVEKVAGALQWLYDKVKTAIEDLIDYLKFLFDLPDFKRTKKVIKNLTQLFLKHQVSQIDYVKGQFDGLVAAAEKAINQWAGLPDLGGLGSHASSPVTTDSSSANHSAPGLLLVHHYQGNAHDATFVNPLPTPSAIDNPIEVLLNALEREAATIGDAIERLRTLAADFFTKPFLDVLKELVAIIGDLVLESARNVIDTVFDILSATANALLDILEMPIHFPVISDILNFFGIDDFSYLDIVCWVAAIPTTLMYKLVRDEAPFPDNDETNRLIDATDYLAVLDALQPKAVAHGMAMSAAVHLASPDVVDASAGMAAGGALQPTVLPSIYMATSGAVRGAGPDEVNWDNTRGIVFIVGSMVAGICSLAACFLSSLEASGEQGTDANPNTFAKPALAVNIIGGIMGGVAGACMPNEISVLDPGVLNFGRAVNALRILCKLGFNTAVMKKKPGTGPGRIMKKFLAVKDERSIGAVVDAVFVIPSLFVTVWHLVELSKRADDSARSIAIVNEASNVTSYGARIFYAVAVTNEGEVKEGAAAMHGVSLFATSVLQFADGFMALKTVALSHG